ncbi:aminoacyl-tRNA deacylase [Colwellia psychrerythraea]|uniref:YbaK/prolyl-tRNA synthetase associated region n=1 Tax=Colwellia psychrerythraea TaxID=28229 RepID=A0A099L2D2_COLPS|nr:YbaK/EbsC family protein [Colwellia psychrerythraea]KGJ96317.1 YbaK/prolyl-tRNA synthetase associated region [Colwellia psychrerythraea]
MNTSTRLTRYLIEKSIPYQEIEHFHSNSSICSAITANISLKQIAKAVLLKNHEDKKLMAILPAAHKISLSALNKNLHGCFRLMKEQEVYQVFSDCNHGAVPPAAEAYHLSMVCERELDQLAEVYLEAGDHETLLRVSQEDFKAIMSSGKHLHFSREVFH